MNNSFNHLNDDIEFLDVLPKGYKPSSVFRVHSKKKYPVIVLLLVIIIFSATISIVIKNRSYAALDEKNLEKKCVQELYLSLIKTNNKEIIHCNVDSKELLITYQIGQDFFKLAYDYYHLVESDEGVLEQASIIENKADEIGDEYASVLINAINKLKLFYNNYQYLEKEISNLNNLINSNTIQNKDAEVKLNGLKSLYYSLDDSVKKSSLANDIILVEEIINKQKNEDSEKQLEVSTSWTILQIPYISQNDAKVYNGCEVACLLMGLKYKGYSLDKKVTDFANLVPKSDNPEEGFYLDIYGTEPKNEAHWIAPEALREFGISQTKTDNIINSTSWDLEQLDDEVVKGNPVIIYLTSSFNNPINFKNGVPQNLHVLLLAGYNKVTKEQLIIDPWNYHSASSYWIVSYDKVNKIYEKIGKKSLIIR